MLSLRDVGPGLDGPDIYALKITILELTAAAVSYGFFLCIGLMSAYTLIRNGLRGQRARQALLTIILTMLLAATAHLALYMAYILLQFQTLAAEYVDPTVILKRLNISQTWLRRLTYFLSDIIVVWRAWVIWQENRIVHAGLAVCLIGTGATSLITAVFNFKSEFHGAHYDRMTLNFLGTFGLLFTNFAVTVLIGYKLWYYRRNVKKYINRTKDGHTKVEGVLILLMESGFFYCIFWILLMLGDFGYFGHDFGFEWFQPNISGIYPTIMIFMVSRQMMMSAEALTSRSHPNSNRTERTIWFTKNSAAGRSGGSDDASVVLNSFSNK
ncbi:hypothetical protein B0H17DRAFT_1331634 [Mycena rosella]|uniref:Uncharacterized protein n=1 Tax=Mycena rosella TaxID=1033263 RepID=A0AAD7GGJ4_MYCRO|nr:hypothetical protein B0H17DRAFT_1331634 [Mycena rosella]